MKAPQRLYVRSEDDGDRPHGAHREVLGVRPRAPRPSRRPTWPRAWRATTCKSATTSSIVGAGVHGLATAYYLAANHGITNVAVLDKGYIGGGGSGRNTAIVRSNYLTPEGVRVLRPLGEALREPVGGSELQRHVRPAGSPHAGPQRLVAAHDALAGRGQQARRRRLRGHRAGRDQAARPLHGTSSRHALPDPRRALPPTRRDHPPRRRQLGLRPRRRRRRRARSTSRPR